MSTDANKYQQLFLEEAEEHMQTLNDALLKFEKKPDPNLAQEMMRAAHTLKSSAASMGYQSLAEMTHIMEDSLDAVRKGKKHLSEIELDLLFRSLDAINKSLEQIKATQQELDLTSIIMKLKALKKPSSSAQLADTEGEQKKTEGAEKEGVEGLTLAQKPETIKPIEEVKVKTSKLDTLMNLMEELLVNRMQLGQLAENEELKMKSRRLQTEFKGALNQLDRIVSDLQYNIMQARLIPVEQIFNRFPRMVRDLAKKEGKEIDFQISGGEIELDRTLINKIGEPLVHLLRNAVDHGIEKKGTIKLSARREKGVAVIQIEDDGKGINWEKVKSQKSLRLRSGQAPVKGEQKLEEFLFSGMSTSEKVSEVSGRGVGLTVVKQEVEEVGGKVSLESPVNGQMSPKQSKLATGQAPVKGGTRFTLELPLTLAIAQALLVKTGEEKFAIPLSDVDRLVRLKKEQVKRTADIEAAVIADEDVPLIRLAELFALSTTYNLQPTASGILAVLAKIPASTAGRRNQTIGFVVDEVLAEQDIVIKPLTGILREQKGLSGATILGDGSVVLILDMASLVDIQNEKSEVEKKRHSKRSEESLAEATFDVANASNPTFAGDPSFHSG